MKTLIKIHIPPRLRDGCMRKEALAIPNTPEGANFTTWWDGASSDDRDSLMKVALKYDISMLDAVKKKDAIVEEIE